MSAAASSTAECLALDDEKICITEKILNGGMAQDYFDIVKLQYQDS